MKRTFRTFRRGCPCSCGYGCFVRAAALGDIGQHFPDTDPEYEGISSIELLKKVGELLEEKGYVVENIDATIIAQRPKLLNYRPKWQRTLQWPFIWMYPESV